MKKSSLLTSLTFVLATASTTFLVQAQQVPAGCDLNPSGAACAGTPEPEPKPTPPPRSDLDPYPDQPPTPEPEPEPTPEPDIPAN